jgi:thimet oligopeptidase
MTNELLEYSKKVADEIINAKEKNQNILDQLNDLERHFSNNYSLIYLLNSVSPKKELRDACNEAVAQLSKASIELKMNKGLFDALEAAKKNLDGKLDPESDRYLNKLILERKLDGLHLDEATRKKVTEIKEKISDLEVKFNKNCTEEIIKYNFKPEELVGVNKDVLGLLEKTSNGECVVTLDYPVYFPIMKECKVPETRSKLCIAFDKRCANINNVIFEEILEKRAELSKLLGYRNFSEYTLQLLCAKTPERVTDFLDKLADKMRILQKEEMDILLKYKKDDCKSLGIPFDGKLKPSDMKYYVNMREEKEFKIDHQKLKEYFPLERVLSGTFHIYQTLLGLRFEEVTTEKEKYHDDVKLYEVFDVESNQLIGQFYIDLHPREGKYGHAAVFPIKSGCMKLNKKRQLPVCMMVCNFTKPTENTPSLLSHDEVETYFHEFGHVMHQVCTKANYSKFR